MKLEKVQIFTPPPTIPSMNANLEEFGQVPRDLTARGDSIGG